MFFLLRLVTCATHFPLMDSHFIVTPAIGALCATPPPHNRMTMTNNAGVILMIRAPHLVPQAVTKKTSKMCLSTRSSRARRQCVHRYNRTRPTDRDAHHISDWPTCHRYTSAFSTSTVALSVTLLARAAC